MTKTHNPGETSKLLIPTAQRQDEPKDIERVATAASRVKASAGSSSKEPVLQDPFFQVNSGTPFFSVPETVLDRAPEPAPAPAPASKSMPMPMVAVVQPSPLPHATPPMPALASPSTANTAVGSASCVNGTDSDTNSVVPTAATVMARNNMTEHWVNSIKKYGPTDWHNSTFTQADKAASPFYRMPCRTMVNQLGNDINRLSDDVMSELTVDRSRLPTLQTNWCKNQRRSLLGMVTSADGQLRVGATFRAQHDDGGPMEPTGPLHGLRMTILCNFAANCLKAEHAAVAIFTAPELASKAKKTTRTTQGAHATTTAAPAPASLPLPVLNPVPTSVATPPPRISLCKRCARCQDFVMREQHGRLFLESVLLPLSQRATYTEMLMHVNTCVAERVFTESGLGSAPNANYNTDTAYPWEDIKAMPVYEDYQGALVLVTHRQRVLSMRPMATDGYGFLYGTKERK